MRNHTQSAPARTITSLRRWSITNKELPAVPQVRSIHVYDFDNTLFLSPLPNPQLWNGPTIGFLQAYESFANGGWWHDPNLLSATGEGIEKEEPRAWEGWWNEQIVQLVKLSMEQKDALTVLLTGRSESGFSEIIKRMVNSKKLEFDLICLKPEVGPRNQRFATTMEFKQTFLEDLILTYEQAEDLRIYEDRPKHAKGFRDYFEQLNRKFQPAQGPSPRKPITSEVIQVAEGSMYLDPVWEAAEVQRMINSHNLTTRNPSLNKAKSPYGRLRIKRTIFYTGYLISNADSSRLIREVLTPMLPYGLADSNDLKYMANSILITPRPAPRSILDKVGGIGKKLSWQITGTACFENRVWAARMAPVPATEKYYTENPQPVVVLAVRKGARPIDAGKIQNWHPVPADKALIVETVVGEKVVLRVEEENPNEGEWESQFLNKNNKRRHQQERNEEILYPPHAEQQPATYDGAAASASHHHHHPHHPHGRQPHPNTMRNGGNRHHHDDSGPSRRGNAFRGRGRGGAAGRGRGGGGGHHQNRGGNRGGGGGGGGRGRGGGGGGGGGSGGRDNGPPGYRSLDDYGGGYEGNNYEEKPGPGGGPPVMNY
ncbi:rRNA 2'-O-methyltransferase fibrillarin-like protein [Aspergillus fijiensis CBS 313.89]|uniref:Tat pathway signal sequence n=1 Tax=Aspergillus fijiensis CBS 313.89 TaxID=1448319 RepID=A0A8G1RSH6_9EURO|nr:tat pathway signal sequence [Aspergillus fijiensis CBS 313.89]RAK78665.1 tat pathway signal sequence [Aspergillus fijiensis CBS 313.89]